MKIAATCIQLIRDIEHYRASIEAAGVEIVTPTIPGQHLEGDALVAAMDGCIGVVAGDDRFSRDVIARLPELKVISKWGIGVDGIDFAAAADHGITVRNTPGMFDDEVADVTMAYVIGLARYLHVIHLGIREGGWPKPPGMSLRGATLGIVGLGGIGRAVAVRAIAAGMDVCGFDPSPDSVAAAEALGVRSVSFADLLPQSDFVSINCPLNPATFHLFDDAAFAAMKPGARLVNTGRGAVVETDALLRALDAGTLGGAALDVMESEPAPAGSAFLTDPRLVFGSHNASNTLEASARVHVKAIGNLFTELGIAWTAP